MRIDFTVQLFMLIGLMTTRM